MDTDMKSAKEKKSLNPPTTHTHIQTQRFAQETLPSLHRRVLLQLKLKEAEDSSAHDEEFHLGNITTDTGAGAVAERNESGLLAGCETIGAPALRNEFLSVRAPDFLGAVDCVAGHGENVAWQEGVAADLDGVGAGGDLAGETH